MTQIFWTEQEFSAVAQALRKQFPDRCASQAATPQQFVFNKQEVGVMMRATLPKDRQRGLSKGILRKLASMLIEAGGGVAPPAKQRRMQTHPPVRWTPAEWRALAQSLLKLYPQLDLLNSSDLVTLRLHHLNTAAKTMASGRQRTFVALTDPIARLRAIYTVARLDGKILLEEVPAKPVATAPVSKPPTATLPSSKPSTAPRGAAVRKSAKVYWTKHEWVQVAAELHRQFPHVKYPERNHLGALTPADVAGAQHVLPEGRHRKNVKLVTIASMRPQLLDAFKTVRQMLTDEAQQKMASAQQQHADMLLRAAAVAAVPNQWELAFKPFVALLVQELGAALLPQLLEAMRGASAAPRASTNTQLSLAPAAASHKRLRVGILGNRNTYAADLGAKFPTVEFTCIDTHKQIESLRNCDKVVAMISFISHPARNAAQRVAGDRFVPINGGLSDIMRVVSSWLVSEGRGGQADAA